jgi:hypothetical protein
MCIQIDYRCAGPYVQTIILCEKSSQSQKGGHLPNPTTINVDIPEKYSQLVLHDSGVHDPDRILVLGDKELLVELNKDTIYGDGTFDKVTNMFYQLYT